jgi:hypothetical protein
MMRAEKSLLVQRLAHQLQTSIEQKGQKDETRQDLELALAEAQALYKSACAEHADRSIDINKSHAKQCEQLCREVVQANKEAMRLQKKLSEFTRGPNSIDRSIVTLRSPEKPSPKRKRRRKIIMKRFLFILMCVVFALYELDWVPTNKMTNLYPNFTVLKGISALKGISTDGISALQEFSMTDGLSALKGISWTDGMSALKGISWTDGISALKGISWTDGMSALHGTSFTDLSTTEDTAAITPLVLSTTEDTSAITPLVLAVTFPEEEAVDDLEVELESELRQGSIGASQGQITFAGWCQSQVSALERFFKKILHSFFKKILHKASENHEHKVRLGTAVLSRE